MRKSFYSAGAVVASVALLAVGAPTASQANTEKELNVSWTNNANGTTDLDFVADGPAFRSANLDTGDSMAWHVLAGQYKITVENVEEFINSMTDECAKYGAVGNGHYKDLNGNGMADSGEWLNQPNGSIKIKRQGEAYTAWPLGALINGEITTNVKANRRTSILVEFHCDTKTDLGIG